jgi:hypothetical protein
MKVRCWCGRWLCDVGTGADLAERYGLTIKSQPIDGTLELFNISSPAASGPRGRAPRTGAMCITVTSTLELICPRHGPHPVTGAELERALRHGQRDFRVRRRPAP